MSDLTHRADHRSGLLAFVALTFALSWGFWGLMLVAFDGDSLGGLVGPIGAFGPPLAALLLAVEEGETRPFWAGIGRWRIGWWWVAVALLPFAVLLIGWAALLALGLPAIPDETPALVTLPLVIVFLMLFGGGQEEPGWRGFALPRLQAHMNALAASVLLGLVWAAWHLPLFVFDASGQAGLSLGVYFPYVIGLSVILTSVFNSTGGSVLAVMVLHALVNLAGGFIPMRVSATAELATLVAVWIVAGILITAYGPTHLSRRERRTVETFREPPRAEDSAQAQKPA